MTRKLDATLLLVLCLSAFAWMPLAAPGYFLNAHDAPHSLFFLESFDEAIRDGAWWPAWGSNFAFGYGYPLWIFYAPLTYFAGELFHLLGANITTAMKLVDLCATLAATLSMYAWARTHFGKQAAAFAAIVYTYAPYHLLDLYVRSAAAEYATFVFFPLLFWRWEVLLAKPSRANAVLAALVTAGLILTHHGAAFIFASLLGAYLIFVLVRLQLSSPQRSLDRIAHSAFAGLLALGLSAIFWLPVLLEQKYIVVEQWTSVAYNYQKHFVYLNQFFSPFWGYGYSGEYLADGMSFQLGLMPVLGGIVALLSRGSRRLRSPARRATIRFFLGATALIALLMSPVSGAFWQAAPVAALVQFPWRLLALSTIALAWLAGAALEALLGERPFDLGDKISNGGVPLTPTSVTPDHDHAPARYRGSVQSRSSVIPASVILPKMPQLPQSRGRITPGQVGGEPGQSATVAFGMLIVVFAGFNYTLPQYTERSIQAESARAAVDFELVSYRDRTGYMTWAGEQPSGSPMVAEYQSGEPPTRAVVLRGEAQLTPLHDGGQSHSVAVTAAGAVTIQFRVYYFPGWTAFIDGKPVSLWPDGPQALITLDVPPGQHQVELRLLDTNVRAIAKALTVLSLLAMAAWLGIGLAMDRRARVGPAARNET